jgi:enoyl-CoA hydratase/carnithine racemase
MTERVSISIDGQLAMVRLNRPDKHNALDLPMFEALIAAQRQLRTRDGLRAVILAGSGVDFCTGLDVRSVMPDRRGILRLLWKWLPWRANLAQQVSVGWRRLPVPVIAAIHGRCWGGGLQIALGADFRLVTPDASLSIMESKWGLVPDMGGSLALRELLGRDQAMQLAMTAEEVSGTRAVELGLATAVVVDPLEAARELAARLAERDADTVNLIKRLFRRNWSGGTGAALARETGYQLKIMARRLRR